MIRWLYKLWAKLNGYFWLPCPICGKQFAGFEWKQGSIPTAQHDINKGCCPDCAYQAGVISGLLKGKIALYPTSYKAYQRIKDEIGR